MISFVVPAHNEESLLPRTLAAIRAAADELGADYEIVVADDASTDDTANVAQRHGARVVPLQARQIAASRNAGAREARGDILIFVDADTEVTSAVVRAVPQALDAGAVGGGCSVRFDGRVPFWARLVAPVFMWAYRRKGLAAGCFVFCSRSAFAESGGFDESLFAAEEVAISGRLKQLGRFVVLREHVITSGRKLRTYSGFEIFKVLFQIGIRGRRGVRDRRLLDIWYAPRRPDPQ